MLSFELSHPKQNIERNLLCLLPCRATASSTPANTADIYKPSAATNHSHSCLPATAAQTVRGHWTISITTSWSNNRCWVNKKIPSTGEPWMGKGSYSSSLLLIGYSTVGTRLREFFQKVTAPRFGNVTGSYPLRNSAFRKAG